MVASTSVTPFSVSTGGTVPRRRFQRGCLFKRGKKLVWVGIFREDRLLTDGTIKRIQRKVVLGPCNKVSERAAYAALQPYLDAVNVAPAPAPKVGKTLLSAVQEWREQIAVNLKPSTVRAAESHLKRHILHRLGSLRLQELDAAQVGQIITSAKEPFATMFALLGMTGLRAGEMLGLKVADLDFNHKVIHIRRSVDSRTKKEQSTKSKGSTSDVPMPPALEKRLKDFLLKNYRENPNGYLFANRNGNCYSVGKVTEYGLWPVQKALNIDRTGLHAFRHAAASELLEQGAPLPVVQRQLRHRDARTTLQKYGHVVGDSQRRAVETLAAKIERHAVVELLPTAELLPTSG